MKRGVLVAAGTVLLSWSTVMAASPCTDHAAGVTTAIRACLAADLGREDARLNRDYRRLIAALDPAARQQLLAAQRAWLAFRTADCRFQAGLEGSGTLGPVIADQCTLDTTVARAAAIERLLTSTPSGRSRP